MGPAIGLWFGVVLLWLNLAPWLALGGIALLDVSLAPMFPSLISLTPARVGPAHTANTVDFQMTAAVLGGAVLVSSLGPIARSLWPRVPRTVLGGGGPLDHPV